MNDRLFEVSDRLADDVYALSAAVDSMVETRVLLDEFFSSVAVRLNRAIDVDVFGGRVQGWPDGGVRWGGRKLFGSGAGAADVVFRFEPPLPEWAGRFVDQRLIHAVRVLACHDPAPRVGDQVGDQVRVLLGAAGPDGDHLGALRKLGLDGARSLTVVAISGAGRRPEQAACLADALAGGDPAPSARFGDVLAVILRRPPNLEAGVPKGLSVGLGEPLPPNRLRDSWEGASTALRFSLPSRNPRAPYRMIDAVIVDIRKVGCLRILAEAVDRRGVRDLQDVRAIEELDENGLSDTLNVLEAVAATESIRQAAQLVHLHHNTVAHRVEAAEGVLGFPLREIYGRTRLLIALTLYRLSRGSAAVRPRESVSRPRLSASLAN